MEVVKELRKALSFRMDTINVHFDSWDCFNGHELCSNYSGYLFVLFRGFILNLNSWMVDVF